MAGLRAARRSIKSRRKQKAFFFEKKKQKILFPRLSHLAGEIPYRETRGETKVFRFFSSEKNMLSIRTPAQAINVSWLCSSEKDF